MSNPRLCRWCRRPEAGHRPCGQAGSLYEGVKRTEPLRAKRGSDPLDDVIAQLQRDPNTDLLIERDGEPVAVIITWDRLMRLRRKIARSCA